MMMQLPLFHDLPVHDIYDIDDFIVSGCNKDAVAWISSWPRGSDGRRFFHIPPVSMVMLSGPAKSGKTHLVRYWQERVHATIYTAEDVNQERIIEAMLHSSAPVVIEECHAITNENAWFHVLNLVKERNSVLLMTSLFPVSALDVSLPDLLSRLAAVPSLMIEMPDDELVHMLILRYCALYQLHVEAHVIDFIAARVERSYGAIYAAMECLSEESLVKKHAITVPFVKSVLGW